MDDIAEKRVFAGSEGATTLVVAAAPGLVGVSVAGDRVGEFGLARRCEPADVAAAAGRLAAATDGDVLLADEPDVDALTGTGFGPAAAVSFDGDRPVAASPEGLVGAYGAAGDRGSDGWTMLGEVPAPPAALHGDLAATADGVFRLAADGPVPAGLADVRDVGRVAGVPLAATATGLYELGNGWMDALDGDVCVVAGTPGGRAHAATPDELFARVDGGWRAVDLSTDDRVVALAHGGRRPAGRDRRGLARRAARAAGRRGAGGAARRRRIGTGSARPARQPRANERTRVSERARPRTGARRSRAAGAGALFRARFCREGAPAARPTV